MGLCQFFFPAFVLDKQNPVQDTHSLLVPHLAECLVENEPFQSSSAVAHTHPESQILPQTRRQRLRSETAPKHPFQTRTVRVSAFLFPRRIARSLADLIEHLEGIFPHLDEFLFLTPALEHIFLAGARAALAAFAPISSSSASFRFYWRGQDVSIFIGGKAHHSFLCRTGRGRNHSGIMSNPGGNCTNWARMD